LNFTRSVYIDRGRLAVRHLGGGCFQSDPAIPYHGADHVAAALSRDPALRSLPSDELARRTGTTRAHAEQAIHGLVVHHTGHRLQVAGRSFDEAISDAGMARRAALSPEPLNEAAGFGFHHAGAVRPGAIRSGAGASMIERHAMMSRAVAMPQYMRSRTGRRVFAGFDAGGYQTPPIPDLSTILLSDAFPVTRRRWTQGNQPTADEIKILNWQHPLVTNASSPQSMATLKAISAGCRTWDTPTTVGGNSLTPRSSDERGNWWLEMQQILNAVSSGTVQPHQSNDVVYDLSNPVGSWGLMPPKITADETDLQYWDLSDASHPRMKMVMWMNKALLKLGSSSSILDGTWAKSGAHWQISVSGNVVKQDLNPDSADIEKETMQYFAGLGGLISGLTSAIAAAVSVYCPACSVAIKIAGNLATNAANGAVTTKALASYGDQMLTDAAVRAARGDASALVGLRAFAGALIGLPSGASAGAQLSGGLVYDYLSTLGSAPGSTNVAHALQVYAIDNSNKISNAAKLATAAQVPLLDAQYAVAAMTDTLARFASNVSAVELNPNDTGLQLAQMNYVASRTSLRRLAPQSLDSLPMVGPQTATQPMSTGTTVAVVGGAIGLAWAAGLLKGLI